ncbi:SDR family NAD(P)-dependent oxidoreductase [Chloroflexota bacterium]
MRLAGKVAIITGASSGIGRESSVMFAREGARIVVADIDDVGGHETVAQVKFEGSDAIFIHTNVAVASQVENMISTTISKFGRIDILFNIVGVHLGKVGEKIEDNSEAHWDEIFAVNTKSVFLAAKYAIPEMKKAGGGVILNTSTDILDRPIPYNSVYIGSKGAVVALTRAMAVELASSHIRVNSISPGATDTPTLFSAGIIPEGLSRQDALAERGKTIPMGRINTTREIAYAAIYLVSDEAATVTGVDIRIDGGRAI